MTRANDRVASVFVDLGRRAAMPDASRPILLWAHVKLRDPRPDGLSSAQEAPTLLRLGDALAVAARATSRAEIVGRITTAGYREMYFYAPSAEGWESVVNATLAAFPGYMVMTGSRLDPKWSQYLDVLYPSPSDLQRIKNQALYEVLRESGDVASVRRVVSHWSSFETQRGRDAFVARAVANGYRERAQAPGESTDRFRVHLERESTTDQATMDAVSVELDEWTREAGGEYDGWETSVEKGR